VAQKFIVPITIKQLASAGSDALTVFVNDESYGRVKLEAGGRISWSDGTGTHDTNLYRDSANVLATDDVFKAVSGVITMAVSGVPTASLPNGALAVDILNNAFYFRSNSTWTQVTGGGGGASLTVGDTAPAAPNVGDLWFESDTAKTFVYYDSQWVEIGGAGPQGPVGPTGPIDTLSDVTITSVALNDVIAWNGSAWVNNSALLAAKAPLASPTFTGTVTVPTPVSNTDASTKAYVDSTVSTTAGNASTALTNHEADTTSIHGIADTSILITTTGTQTLTNKTITSPSGLVKGDVGLGNVDNTSDANKPVSTAGQTALDLKAPLASPTFTGTVTIPAGASISGFAPLASPALTDTPTAPTAAALTNTTQIATTAFVTSAVSSAAIATLDEIGDVAAPTPTNGDLLKWNGTAWVNAAGYALLASPTFTGTVTTTDLTVSGNLTVSGTTTSINTATLNVADNIVVLNNDVTGSPTENAGIEVERGTSTNVSLRWNETDDKWQFTNDGSTYVDFGAGGATISETAPASPTVGQLWFNSSTLETYVYYDSHWLQASGEPDLVEDLTDLSDVLFTTPVSGQFLKFDGTRWVNGTIPTINTLDDIGDVSASAPSSGQFLKWNGSAWVAETIIGGATISDTAPASPLAGQLWFQSTNGKTFVYYDSSWIEVGGVGTGARMVSSSSAPASPLEGSMWFDTDTAQTFVYYDSQWIEIGASGVTASVQDSAPAAPVSGQIWFNSLTGGTYVYYGTNWIEVGASPFTSFLNTINAKGDLLVGTADNTIGGLTAGSANQVLTVDSSTATGLKWATPVSTGKAIAMSIVFGG
jgi:hypothetical protein